MVSTDAKNVCRPASRTLRPLGKMAATYVPSSPAFHVTPEVLQQMGQLARCTVPHCKSAKCRGLTTCSIHTPPQECPICYDTMTNNSSYETPCGHRFHMNCLLRWKGEEKNTCPMCRTTIFTDMNMYFPVDGVLTEIVNQDMPSWLRMLNLR